MTRQEAFARSRATSRSISRRLVLAAVGALIAATAILPGSAGAQEYPSKPVRIIVPFAAGGPADVYARFIAQRLQDALKQSFVVEDRPGGGSLIGTEAVAKSAPDGYTLLMMSNTHTVNESLFAASAKPYQLMRDFAPVAPINYSDLVLVARPGLQVNNLGDLVKLAKAKPGTLTYASSGPGTPYHMAGELFKAMTGTSILHVPYKGSSGARTDVLGGQVDMMFDAVPTMVDFIRSGKVKALGTSGKAKSTVMPELPTIAEAGVPNYEAVIWLGIMAPANTPPAIVNKLNAEINKIAVDPEVVSAWGKKGAIAMKMTPAEFGKFMNDDIAKWAQIVKISGAKPDQ
ncbi:Tripartite-type tricarboxylate transporter, receptor component TctC [Noviherbaspirillum humi]|uniref:Tripartite-type tricarboxylate transporter, receptor component TctC n=1 Tax=Noviherbaspirillum humi TaxID=1688639 RepID=A0A239KKD7_9BURK|nr:tripartite tricarboxylate transporter substrate binding protein [Noviherbaspirillum humi]SNT18152.1 Tripartite-type tricarboxylate transporter, receptor component TctC [Noviherbaspirillum humi]